MSLEAYMLEKKEEVIEYVASTKFKDKEGNPIPWKLKKITAKENDKIRKQCYEQVLIPGKRGQYRQEFDTTKYLEKLAIKCIVEPNLNSVELQDFYHVMGAEDLLKEHLLNPAEYDNLTLKLQEINGYDMEEAVAEAKN